MRLIDADKLKEALKSNCKPELCHDYNTAWCGSCCRTNDFEDLIDNAPTVLHDNYSMGYQDGIRKVLSERPKGEINADLFKQTFGIYATELWAMNESQFLEWLNSEYDMRKGGAENG